MWPYALQTGTSALRFRSPSQDIAGGHGNPVRNEVREAHDDNNIIGEGCSDDPRYDRERRDDPVISSQNEIGQILANRLLTPALARGL